MVTVVVAEVDEAICAGQPVLAIEETGKRWLSFNVREDLLHGLGVGATVRIGREGTAAMTPALVTELSPLGVFATWQAERAVGDHDRNTLRLRLDPQGDATTFQPGMTIWVSRRCSLLLGILAAAAPTEQGPLPCLTRTYSAVDAAVVGDISDSVRSFTGPFRLLRPRAQLIRPT